MDGKLTALAYPKKRLDKSQFLCYHLRTIKENNMESICPIGELKFNHNGNQKYVVTVDVWEEYDLETEKAGSYCAKLWVDGDTSEINYFPSEESASCWIMEKTGATKLTYA
jgi:hypothetical protein